jgi:hypothetical protein
MKMPAQEDFVTDRANEVTIMSRAREHHLCGLTGEMTTERRQANRMAMEEEIVMRGRTEDEVRRVHVANQ